MREGKKLEIKPETLKVENSLLVFKEREMRAMQEDKTYPRAWEHIDPNKLSKKCQEVFDLYKKGDYDSLTFALSIISTIKEEIKVMKDKDTKNSTQKFIEWIDDKVQGAQNAILTRDELAK
jgi:hypothetical protein